MHRHEARFHRLWQYDIVHFVLFSATLCIGIAWLVESHRTIDMQIEIDRLSATNRRLAVNGILNGRLPRRKQAAALGEFIELGDQLSDLCEWVDVAGTAGSGTGPLGSPVTRIVFFADSDLVVEEVNGRVTAIGRADECGCEWIIPKKDSVFTAEKGGD